MRARISIPLRHSPRWRPNSNIIPPRMKTSMNHTQMHPFQIGHDHDVRAPSAPKIPSSRQMRDLPRGFEMGTDHCQAEPRSCEAAHSAHGDSHRPQMQWQPKRNDSPSQGRHGKRPIHALSLPQRASPAFNPNHALPPIFSVNSALQLVLTMLDDGATRTSCLRSTHARWHRLRGWRLQPRPHAPPPRCTDPQSTPLLVLVLMLVPHLA